MQLHPWDIMRARFRYGTYGFVPGIIIGIFLGWFFHGVISTIVRFGFLILLLLPFIIGFIVWRRVQDRDRQRAPVATSDDWDRLAPSSRDDQAFETTGTVIEVRPTRER